MFLHVCIPQYLLVLLLLGTYNPKKITCKNINPFTKIGKRTFNARERTSANIDKNDFANELKRIPHNKSTLKMQVG
jgi:hypothetical protein